MHSTCVTDRDAHGYESDQSIHTYMHTFIPLICDCRDAHGNKSAAFISQQRYSGLYEALRYVVQTVICM